VIPAAPPPRDGLPTGLSGYALSLVDGDLHYIRDEYGREELYDLRADPKERSNLVLAPAGQQAVGRFREALLRILTQDPPRSWGAEAAVAAYRKILEAQIRARSVAMDASPTTRGQ
jgi:hypothetical protein